MSIKTTLYDYCIKNDRQELLTEWDTEKNGDLTPSEVSYGSKRKIWWRCQNNHSWQTSVYVRTGGSGCPYCSHKRPFSGVHSLSECSPEIAAQWHSDKNGDLTPDKVYYLSHKSVWWCCDKGHEWRAEVRTRVNGRDCPICANRKVLSGENDLATTHPELIKEWDFEKNTMLAPQKVGGSSDKKVWWICPKGHSWQATIYSRTRGSGCPICAGKVVIPNENDLLSMFPAVARQWNCEKNESLRPENVAPYSNRRVWWRCDLGHEYQAAVGARTNGGIGCPYCSSRKVLLGFNDLKSRYPDVAAQWHPALNGKLTPEMVTYGSSKKVWWKCKHGHIWKAVINSRTSGCGCPVCAGKTISPYYGCDPEELERKLLNEQQENADLTLSGGGETKRKH